MYYKTLRVPLKLVKLYLFINIINNSMGLYKLFSYNVEIQYKSCLLSKAMVFTLITTSLNIILPFLIAYRSRGFWLKTHHFYEQPVVRFTYDYILIAETDDPSQPIVCGDASTLSQDSIIGEENCVHFEVREQDYNGDGKNDELDFIFHLIIPDERKVTSIIIILAVDFQLKTICPFHMQSLALIEKSFAFPSSSFKYYGDVDFYQVAHLPCLRNMIDTKYNNSLLNYQHDDNENVVDSVLRRYFERKVTTQVKTLFSRSANGYTGKNNIELYLRVPEMLIKYKPSVLQELKWAWPQYLSLVAIFYWVFNKIKRFVFNNRLLMAWEVLPWKKA